MAKVLFVLYLWLPSPQTGGPYAWYPDKALQSLEDCERYQMKSPPVEKWKCVKYAIVPHQVVKEQH
jgi:hypothetical protein